MILKYWVAFLSSILLISLAKGKFNRSEGRHIVTLRSNGRISPRDKWPWLAAVFAKQTEELLGGGSLISERFVLSSAHCLSLAIGKPEGVIVSIGIWKLSVVNITKVDVEDIFIHPEWSPSHLHSDADISIVKLASNSRIQPVSLWRMRMRPASVDAGIVVRWDRQSEVVHEARLRVKPIQSCGDNESFVNLKKRGLCVESEDDNPFYGGSGGIFFTAHRPKWYLRGIASPSRVNAKGEKREVFVDVMKFTTWIDKIVNDS